MKTASLATALFLLPVLAAGAQSARTVAALPSMPAPVLNLMLGKMKKAGKIERNPNGLARLTKNAA